jgi:hypothetical protein
MVHIIYVMLYTIEEDERRWKDEVRDRESKEKAYFPHLINNLSTRGRRESGLMGGGRAGGSAVKRS